MFIIKRFIHKKSFYFYKNLKYNPLNECEKQKSFYNKNKETIIKNKNYNPLNECEKYYIKKYIKNLKKYF